MAMASELSPADRRDLTHFRLLTAPHAGCDITVSAVWRAPAIAFRSLVPGSLFKLPSSKSIKAFFKVKER